MNAKILPGTRVISASNRHGVLVGYMNSYTAALKLDDRGIQVSMDYGDVRFEGKWTIAYRKPTANRFVRVSNWAGNWHQASSLAGVFMAANPGLQVFYVTTEQAERDDFAHSEDVGNILSGTGKRVRIVEGGEIPAEMIPDDIIGSQVIRIDDDAAVPMVGTVYGTKGEDSLEVLWDSSNVTTVEYRDALTGHGRNRTPAPVAEMPTVSLATGTKNAGYEIIAVVPVEGRITEYAVTAVRGSEDYVTWLTNGRGHYYWGHHKSGPHARSEALADMVERSGILPTRIEV